MTFDLAVPGDAASTGMASAGSTPELAKQSTFAFLDALEVIDISNNLGDAKSLVTHPATTTHRKLRPVGRAAVGIVETRVRLSVGLEDPPDLIDDLGRALRTV